MQLLKMIEVQLLLK